jgi:hypothetical protein
VLRAYKYSNKNKSVLKTIYKGKNKMDYYQVGRNNEKLDEQVQELKYKIRCLPESEFQEIFKFVNGEAVDRLIKNNNGE